MLAPRVRSMCAVTRIGSGKSATQSARSTSGNPCSKNAPPPASGRLKTPTLTRRPRTDIAPRARQRGVPALRPEEAIELLHVAAEAMVVADHDFLSGLLGGGENSLDAARCE